jgi:hypothetical protein
MTASSHQNDQPFTYTKPEAASAVVLLMMGGVSPKTCWALYKHEIINSDTWLHLVGYLIMNYTMMHGSMNSKFIFCAAINSLT